MDAEGGWADLELAQRIARAGTLSGAARALGVNQTTASRRLAALERRLGVALFDRVGGRLAPTSALGAVRRPIASDRRGRRGRARGDAPVGSRGARPGAGRQRRFRTCANRRAGTGLIHARPSWRRAGASRRRSAGAFRSPRGGHRHSAGTNWGRQRADAKDRRGAVSPVSRRQRANQRRRTDRALLRRVRPSSRNAHARPFAARRARRIDGGPARHPDRGCGRARGRAHASGSLGEPRSALRLRRRYDRRAAYLSPRPCRSRSRAERRRRNALDRRDRRKLDQGVALTLSAASPAEPSRRQFRWFHNIHYANQGCGPPGNRAALLCPA